MVYAVVVGAFVLGWTRDGSESSYTAVLFAVGNLGDAQSPDAAALAEMLAQHRMDALALLGDLAAPDGSASSWDEAYHPNFGAFRQSARPTPGEMEYLTKDAADYFSYFSSQVGSFVASPYYGFTIGSWRIYSLDSRLAQGNPGSDQYEWLRHQLSITTEPCVAAFWHDPVNTAGPSAPDSGGMGPTYSLLSGWGADIVLSAHDANYQRWTPIDGITSFVVGTGGAGLASPTRQAGSLAASSASSVGALELDLHAGSADFQFLTAGGEVLDSGSLSCHGRPTGEQPRPTTPTSLRATPGATGVELSWAPSGGDPVPLGYLIYRGSILTGFSNEPSYVDTSLPPGASVLYSVRAVAPTGARSGPSEPVHSGGGAPGYTDHTWAVENANPAAPTADKPQSKLWWNDGSWWGILFGPDPARPSRSSYFIERFDATAQAWTNTGVEVDDRNRSHADALWDDVSQNLYVASTIRSGGIKLYRYSYSDGGFILDSGFPVRLTEDGSESITIAKDSTGALWVTMTQIPDGTGACIDGQPCAVRVMHSTDTEYHWSQSMVLPTESAAVKPDDVSAVVSYGGRDIGIAWSNQLAGAFFFATHVDGAPDAAWTVETIEIAPRGADDHLNLKSDSAGRVYLIGKTSLNDPANASPQDPLVVLWVRDPDGTWRHATVWTVADQVTRAQVVVDEGAGRVYAIAAQPATGGYIHTKSASVSDLAFAPGLGTVLLASGDINNPTTTKQTVSLRTGILVLAGDTATHTYWHNTITPDTVLEGV